MRALAGGLGIAARAAATRTLWLPPVQATDLLRIARPMAALGGGTGGAVLVEPNVRGNAARGGRRCKAGMRA
jgi:hypothetical protein